MSIVQNFEGKARADEELATITAYAKRLQAVFDSEEYKTMQGGAQKRILKQLNAMYEHIDILKRRISEEEFD